ncbi:Abi family protein [Micrococcus terreus]|uniref:Abi family protein n=1 Tax=Micrococcus terreus TaxID=574650 RepID=UPI003AFAEF6C
MAHARRVLPAQRFFYPYRELPQNGSSTRPSRFVPGTTFTAVTDLYEFDRKLRTLIHDGTEKVSTVIVPGRGGPKLASTKSTT